MPNSLLTPTTITRKAQMILHQKLNFIPNIFTGYDDRFAQTGAKIGSTLAVRLPNQFQVFNGASLGSQDVTEESVTLTVSSQKHVPFTFSSQELTLTIDDFAERYLEPAISVLAAKIEADALNMVDDVAQTINASTASMSLTTALDAGVLLDNSLAPRDNNRYALLRPQAQAHFVAGVSGLFQDARTIAEQYREGQMGRTAGFNFYQNTLLASHTNGTTATTTGYLINDASTLNGSTITVDTGSLTFAVGDVITIAGCNAVHPESKSDLGYERQFVITAAAGSVATSLSISPSIVASGARQNVSTGMLNNAAITKVGGNGTILKPSLFFHKNAFCFATADLVMPDGVDFKARKVKDGISMRIVRQYDINSDSYPCRIDILYGYKTIRPQLAVKAYTL